MFAITPLIILTPIILLPYFLLIFIPSEVALIIAGFFYFCAVLNILGSIGDLYAIWMLKRSPKSIIVDNDENDMIKANLWTSIHEPDLEMQKTNLRSSVISTHIMRFILTWIVVGILMNMVIQIVLWDYIPENPGTFTFLAWDAYFEKTDDWFTFGTSISNYPSMLLLTGLVSGLVYWIAVLLLKLKNSRSKES